MTALDPEDRLVVAVQATAGDVLAYLERRAGREDAEDLLSETMVVAWRRIADLPDEPQHARMWLFGIARTTLFNHVRGSVRRRALTDRLKGQAGPATAAPADDGIAVRDAIARLDPDLAEIVRLVHWERFSLVEVAEMLHLRDSTIRSRYARAKQLLRASLDPATPTAPPSETRPTRRPATAEQA